VSTRPVTDAMVRHPKMLGRDATVADLRHLFRDDHVVAALVVDDGVLVTVVERDDLSEALPAARGAGTLGRLEGRTVPPGADLAETWTWMVDRGVRRLAVVDEAGTCVGLLCLKRSGQGFCSDEGIRARAAERASRGVGGG